MRLRRRTLAWKEELDQELHSWTGKDSFSSFVGRLLSRALCEGLQLGDSLVEHGSWFSKVYIEGYGDGDSRAFEHEVRGEALEGKHIFALRCGGCVGLRESMGDLL